LSCPGLKIGLGQGQGLPQNYDPTAVYILDNNVPVVCCR